VTPDDIIQQHFARFDEKFFHYCDNELLKINTFFSGRDILDVMHLFDFVDSYWCGQKATKF